MTEEKKNKLNMIFDTTLFVISMILQGVSWYLEEPDTERIAAIIRIVSYCLFTCAIFLLLLIEFRVAKRRIVKEQERITYARIACSLAGDYEKVYYLNTDDDSYVGYGTSDVGDEELQVLESGDDFYSDAKLKTARIIYNEDKDKVLAVLNKVNLRKSFDNKEVIQLNYRLLEDGEPLYYSLKVTQGHGEDDKYIIIGVKNVDAQTRRSIEESEAARRGMTYEKIMEALASSYEVLYYVNLETNEYTEYSSTEAYRKLDIGNHGNDFFAETQENMKRDIYPDDYQMMADVMDKNNLLEALSRDNFITVTYRLYINGEAEYVNLRAIRPKSDPNHIVVGVINVNETMKREQEYKERLDNMINVANRDALTGVKNKTAYNSMEEEINKLIAKDDAPEFAIVICDVNDLKVVNDTKGHKAGDEYIREACMIICRIYKHSPVFRVGGDEFAVVLKGDDFENRNALMLELRQQIYSNREENRVVVASGMSIYDPEKDKEMANVFERADQDMYNNKHDLKA
ncbi:MAG: GGDEF domain-containing protein [Eubacterium sp.]|nr:GGDEF domain-containing protein [Eubacterium sp.]